MIPPKLISVPYREIRSAILALAWEHLETDALKEEWATLEASLADVTIELDGREWEVGVSPDAVLLKREEALRRFRLLDLPIEVEALINQLPDPAGSSFRRLHALQKIRGLEKERRKLVSRLRNLDERLQSLEQIKNYEILIGNQDRLALLKRRLKESDIGWGRRSRILRAARGPDDIDEEWLLEELSDLPEDRQAMFRSLCRPLEAVILREQKSLLSRIEARREELHDCGEALADAREIYEEGAETETNRLELLVDHLEERVRLRYREVEQELLELYYKLNLPLEERLSLLEPPGEEDERQFLKRLAGLMAKANYSRVDRTSLERGIALEPDVGIRLDLDLDEAFEEYHFFAKGWRRQHQIIRQLDLSYRQEVRIVLDRFALCLGRRAETIDPDEEKEEDRYEGGTLSRFFRSWKERIAEQNRRFLNPHVEQAGHFIKSFFPAGLEEHETPRRYLLKIFVNVKLNEAEVVIPGTTYKYRWKDLFFVGGGVFGGTVWTVLHQLLRGSWIRLLNPVIGVLIAIGGIIKGVLGMRRTHEVYQKKKEEYENRKLLATGANVIHHFIGEAVEADKKEALLAYVFLLLEDRRPDGRASPLLLQKRIQRFIRRRFERSVAFDIVDAMATLERFRLVQRGGTSEWPRPMAIALPKKAYRTFGEQVAPLPPSMMGGEALQAGPTFWERIRPWGRAELERKAYRRSLKQLQKRWSSETRARDEGGVRVGRDFMTNGPRYRILEGDEDQFLTRIDLLPLEGATRSLSADIRRLLRLDLPTQTGS